MKKKLAVLLFFVITLGFCSLTRYHINEQKVVFENFGLSKNCSLDEGVKAIETTEKIELFIKVSSEEFDDGQVLGSNYTHQEYEEYRKVKREKAINHFYEANYKIFKKLQLSNYLDVYVSRYSPFIEISFDTAYFKEAALEILSNISSLSNIDKIYVKDITGTRTDQSYSNNFAFSGAGSIYKNQTYNASGIKVGLLEYGIIDEDHANFSNANVVVRDKLLYFETETDHANMTGSIICGPNAAAQGCTLYSVELFGNPTSEIEWLLDYDIDIVNMSYSDGDYSGNYNSDTAYIDYIAYTYGVVFVAAAGNYGESHSNIVNPGMGYYVLTVGAIYANNIIEPYSSIWDNDGPPKPTICTLGGFNIPTFGIGPEGTSFSSAFITSFIAMMMEEFPIMRGNPQQTLAFVCANAEYVSHHTEMTGSGLEESVGAGVFRYDSMVDNHDNYFAELINYNNIDSVVYSKQVSLTAGDEFAAAISWKAVTDGTVEGITFTNYDLKLRGPQGQVLAMTNLNTSIIEMIRILNAPTTGIYTIEVIQRTARVRPTDVVYINWSINPSEV